MSNPFFKHPDLYPGPMSGFNYSESELKNQPAPPKPTYADKAEEMEDRIRQDIISNFFPPHSAATTKDYIDTDDLRDDKYIDHLQQIRDKEELQILSDVYYDDLNYDEIAQTFPKEFQARKDDKLRARYPRGESYMDLIQRVEPLIFSIERSKDPVVVVGHQAVIRCMYGYFTRTQIDNVPYLDIPLSTVIKNIFL